MELRDFIGEQGLTNAEVADLLNERGVTIRGRTVEAKDVKRRLSTDLPRAWRAALDLPAADSTSQRSGTTPTGDPDGSGEIPSSRERAPKPPANAKFEVVDRAGAKKRISWAYGFIGTGLAAGSGFHGVADVWADQAPTLAELWIQAAQDNPWAAKVVGAAEAGGPMGDLVAAHVYLLGATAYVTGAALPGGDTIFAKYSGKRYVPPAKPPEPEQPDAESNGAHPGAEDVVGDLLY